MAFTLVMNTGLLLLASFFAALVMTTAARCLCLTTNVNIGCNALLSELTYIQDRPKIVRIYCYYVEICTKNTNNNVHYKMYPVMLGWDLNHHSLWWIRQLEEGSGFLFGRQFYHQSRWTPNHNLFTLNSKSSLLWTVISGFYYKYGI